MTKITEMTQATVSAALRRSDGRFTPAVLRDTKVGGLVLRIGPRSATWVLSYIPHGVREDGRRHGRRELRLGDAFTGDPSTTMTLADARQAAAEAKVAVAAGKDPFSEKQRAKALLVAARATKPMTLDELLNLYQTELLGRVQPSLASRKQAIHYAKKAVELMGIGGLPATALDGDAVLLFVRSPITITRSKKKVEASGSERRHLWAGLAGLVGWLVERRWLDADPMLSVPRRERPKVGESRDYVPSLVELRAIWNAVEIEEEVVRDLVRFLLLVPLRRDEAAGLLWSEVVDGWLKIKAERMKAGEQHELPLVGEAKAIIERRAVGRQGKQELVFPGPRAGEVYEGWGRLLARVRKSVGQGERAKADRFTIHDIRRAFVSTLADRFDENLLDLMLAHRPSSRRGSSAAYQKAKRLPERAAVMTAWERLVLDRAEGVVVPFKTTA